MAYDYKTPSPDVLARHADRCAARRGGECTCGPIGYRAANGGRATGPLVETEAEARAWSREQHAGLDDESTVAAAIDDFLEAEADRVSATQLRALRWALEGHVAPALGEEPLREVRRRQLQALLVRLERDGLPATRVETIADALRELYRYAEEAGLVEFSPAQSLVVVGDELPPEPRRPAAARRLAVPAAVPQGLVPDQAIWLILKVATVVFVLIALILVAESV